MIYGKTNEYYDKKRMAVRAKAEKWHRVFAWFPIVLSDGREVWLQFIEMRSVWFEYEILNEFGHWTTEYRLIKGK